MIRRIFVACAATSLLALAPNPAFAQEEVPEEETSLEEADMGGEMMGQMFGALGEMFAADPLTTEQEARLPLATMIVDKMIPEGSMADMMDNMLGGTLGSIMTIAGEGSAKAKLAEKLGTNAFALDLSDEDAAELLSLFDPQWEERQKREADLMPQMMGEIMSVMEGPMKTAMSELYAINFSTGELGEIDAFFSTPTGASFARKSFTMASDPRIMGASMEALPAMMTAMAGMEQKVAEATADLGEARTFDQLSSEEKAFVTEATGMSAQEIEAGQADSDFDWSDGSVETAADPSVE